MNIQAFTLTQDEPLFGLHAGDIVTVDTTAGLIPGLVLVHSEDRVIVARLEKPQNLPALHPPISLEGKSLDSCLIGPIIGIERCPSLFLESC